MSERDLQLELRLDCLDISTRTVNCLKSKNVDTVGALITLRSADILLIPNAGLKTLNEIKGLLGRMGLKLSGDLIPIEKRIAPVVAEAATLEEELFRFVRAVSTERNAEIVVKLWGWNGEAPRTLESVGREIELTRERVRQIEKKVKQRIRKYPIEAHRLAAAINILHSNTPDIESSLSVALKQSGVSRSEFNCKSLKLAASRLGIEWPFELASFGSKKVLALAGEADKYREAVVLLRRKTSDRGCTNILSLASELAIEDSKLSELRRILDVASKVEWLDDSREWLYSTETSRNRLRNICSKVLGVAPRVHLSELRRAVSRSRRLAMCPPQRVLGAFIERCGLGRVEESFVIANPGGGKAPAEDSAEGLMLRVLDEHGPIMDGDVFEEECIAAGMNATTYYIYRLVSPVICALGKKVYCKVGSPVPPGTVEDIVGRRRRVTRLSDHGWTSTGRLWCGFELIRALITSGGIRLPAFVADFVQGSWKVMLPDGTEYGTVECRELFIWSLKKALVVLGAEPGDLATFEFDLKSRQVLVRVGGPGLFELMQEPDSAIANEGVEEV